MTRWQARAIAIAGQPCPIWDAYEQQEWQWTKALSETPQLSDDRLTAAIAHQVAASLSPAAQKSAAVPQGGKSFAAFASALDALVASNEELRRRSRPPWCAARARRSHRATPRCRRPRTWQRCSAAAASPTKGGTVVRAFWWGFHIQISHEDLQVFLAGANTVNAIVDAIGGNIPSPAAPFIHLAACSSRARCSCSRLSTAATACTSA